MPRISVLMSVYNGADRLPRMLDCLAVQTCRDFELIAVDDGSTDNTVEVLSSYADRLPLRIVSKENGGLSSARNRGLEEAAGEFVYMIDHDDLLHPRAVEYMVHGMSQASADCLIFDCRVIDEPRVSEVIDEFAASGTCPDPVQLPDDKLKWFVDDQRNPGIWQFCFRRQALVGRRFPDGILLEDNLFMFPLLASREFKVYHLPVAVYGYVQQPTSIMHSSKLERRLESFDRIFTGLKRCLSDADYRLLMARHFTPELKSMFRDSDFAGKRQFAAFMRRMFAQGMANPADFQLRWRLRFLFIR